MDNNTPDTNPITQWEAHKCVIRGLLVSKAPFRKRTKQAKIDALLSKIKSLKKAYKRTKAKHTLKELTQTRTLLSRELVVELGKNFALKWM